MPKIKNWTPKKKWNVDSLSVSNQVVGNKVWEHDNVDDLVVQVTSSGVKGGVRGGKRYKAYISYGKYNQPLSSHSSQEEARKATVKWMKKHPNPNLRNVFSNL